LEEIELKTKQNSELTKSNNEKQKRVLEMNGQVERYKIQINNLNDKVGELEV